MSEIRYQFVATGQQSVERAFQTIEAAAKRNAKAVEGAYVSQERAARRSAAVQEREARRPVDRLAQLAKQVERDQIRAAQREAREKAQAIQYVQRIRERHFADQQKQGERAAAQAVRSEQKASKLRERVLTAESRLRDRMATTDARREDQHQGRMARNREMEANRERAHQDRLTRMKESAGRRVSRIHEDAAIRQQRAEGRARERIADSRRSAMYGAIGGALRGAVLGGGTAGLVLGAGVAGAAVKDAYSLQSISNRISINSRKSGQEFMDPTRLRKEFEATALATRGVVSAEDVATGTQAFISKTGDIGKARKFMSTFATTAAATGSSFSDISNAGAELAKKFSLETAEEMQAALASVTFGGKEGAFEISDAATKYAKLASAGATFGLDKGVKGVQTLQGLSQIAMDATGDRDTATTAVEAMFRQIVTESKGIEKLGVDVFTDDSRTKTRSITDLLPEIMAATGGDKVLLQDIFKDEGKRAVNPLIDTFTQAYQGAKGKDGKKATDAERVAAGKAAVSTQLSNAINAPGTFKDLQMDAEQAVDSPAKMAQAWERLTAAAADKLMPALDRMVETFEVSEGAVDAFVGTLEVLLEMMGVMGRALGILKDPMEDKGYRKRQEQNRVKKAERELASLPSEEKAAALAAAGDIAGAAAMRAQLNDPATQQRRQRLVVERDLAASKLGMTENIDEKLGKATALGSSAKSAQEFASLYASMGANGDSAEAQVRANIMAHALAANPTNDTYSTKDFIPGENADQRAARLGFGQGQAERKAGAGGSQNDEVAMAAKGGIAAILEMAKAAREAAPALRKLGESQQPSISSG
ncbi:phage tail tape measure protein [Sorangium sp. So ce118]